MIRRILIVDDEAALLLAFKSIFQNPELIFETTDNQDQAMKMIDTNFYDVIITDLRLSDSISEEGYKIARYVKDKNPDTKIILWTAYGNNDIEQNAKNAGADYYLEKPVTPNEMRNVLIKMGIINDN